MTTQISPYYSSTPSTGADQVGNVGLDWGSVGTALALTGTAVGAYHGYKRNNSVGWAIGWALLGGAFPIIVIPVAFAQGIGTPKRG